MLTDSHSIHESQQLHFILKQLDPVYIKINNEFVPVLRNHAIQT
jgi:hypothetical protein